MPNEFDPDAAADELRAVDGLRPEVARVRVAQITAAALIDLAASLQILAAEAWAAMPTPEGGFADNEPDGPRDFLVVGDLVVVKGDSEPGEVANVGVDQGEAYADVVFANGSAARYYARNLERVVGEDPELADAIDASLAAVKALADVEPTPRKKGGKK
jgi:hypothetical protein